MFEENVGEKVSDRESPAQSSSDEEEASDSSMLQCSLPRLLLSMLLCGIIVLLIFDFSARPCTEVETNAERCRRLFCDSISTENVTTFNLTGSSGLTCETIDDFFTDEQDSGQRSDTSPCTYAAINLLIDWLEDHPIPGFFATIFFYSAATVLLVPGSVLTLGAGAAYSAAFGFGTGLVLASLSVWIGAFFGSALAFLNGRYLLRSFVESLTRKYKVFKVIDLAIKQNGFKVVLLLRLSPIVPFNIFNYLMGATACSLRDYLLGGLLGILPGTVAFVFIGATLAASLGFGSENEDTGGGNEDVELKPEVCDDATANLVNLVLYISGSITSLVVVLLLSRYARKEWVKLRDAIEENEEE